MKRNDFLSLSFNFRNRNGTGIEKSFPLSLLQCTKMNKNESKTSQWRLLILEFIFKLGLLFCQCLSKEGKIFPFHQQKEGNKKLKQDR